MNKIILWIKLKLTNKYPCYQCWERKMQLVDIVAIKKKKPLWIWRCKKCGAELKTY